LVKFSPAIFRYFTYKKLISMSVEVKEERSSGKGVVSIKYKKKRERWEGPALELCYHIQ
jgi:hypothetical protein